MKSFFRIVSVVCLLLTMIAIYLFSNQNANDSIELSKNVADILSKYILFEKLFAVFPYRKLAHFAIYTCLGIVIASTLYYYDIRFYGYYGLLFCFVYACSDEFHQCFVDGRGPMLKDIFIDTFGSITGILLVLCIIRVLYICVNRMKNSRGVDYETKTKMSKV